MSNDTSPSAKEINYTVFVNFDGVVNMNIDAASKQEAIAKAMEILDDARTRAILPNGDDIGFENVEITDCFPSIFNDQ